MAFPEWVILHVPHDSSFIPSSERGHLIISDEELHAEVLALTDWWTFDLFASTAPSEQVVRAGFSRLLIDVERFVSDNLEPMATRGMGAVYERTSGGKPLRDRSSEEERQRLLSMYYHPHHERLTAAVDGLLAHCGRALILDCHSFPSRPLPCDLDQRPDRPDICIGTDPFHTPPALADALLGGFHSIGFAVGLNRPFSGAMVPAKHYQSNKDVASVMIEANRALYMDETTGQQNKTYRDVKVAILNIVQTTAHGFESARFQSSMGAHE